MGRQPTAQDASLNVGYRPVQDNTYLGMRPSPLLSQTEPRILEQQVTATCLMNTFDAPSQLLQQSILAPIDETIE